MDTFPINLYYGVNITYKLFNTINGQAYNAKGDKIIIKKMIDILHDKELKIFYDIDNHKKDIIIIGYKLTTFKCDRSLIKSKLPKLYNFDDFISEAKVLDFCIDFDDITEDEYKLYILTDYSYNLE